MRFSPLQRRPREFVRALRARLAPFGLRRRTMRYLRIAAAYALTIAFLAVVGVVYNAAMSRTVIAAPGALLEEEPGRLASLQAVERIFALPDARESGGDEARLFAPAARAERAAAFKAGATAAARRYLTTLRATRGARSRAWSSVRALAHRPEASEAAIAAAVAALSEAAARGEVALSAEADDRHLAASAAMQSCTEHENAFRVVLDESRAGPVPAAHEAAFHRARGAAYAWALILHGLEMDAAGAAVGESTPVRALYRAGAYQPLFLSNAPPEAILSPNHFTHLAFQLDRAGRMLFERHF